MHRLIYQPNWSDCRFNGPNSARRICMLKSTSNDVNIYMSNSRFWLRTERVMKNETINLSEESIAALSGDIDIRGVSYGIAFLSNIQTIVPIHDGKLQLQHASQTPDFMNDNTVTVCAFAPRASHVCISPNEYDRAVDPERLACLDTALLRLGTATPEELMREEYAGTPPARIYRSFVSPRPKAKNLLEPVERAANRTALQIELAVRYVTILYIYMNTIGFHSMFRRYC